MDATKHADTAHHHDHAGDHHGHGHHHHEMPTEGRALTGVAVSATLHCLTGCAIGEVAGMAIGTAAGFSDLGTIALAVALAFLFGYALTSLPLLRAGLALGAVIPIALASDTVSIATMEVVDNAIMVIIPGAMESGLGDILFWGALSFALFVAFVLTVPVNRWLIGRGKGHTAVHETGIHGGPPVKVVAVAVVAAALFGGTVLTAEALDGDAAGHGGGEHDTAVTTTPSAHGHEEETMASTLDQVRGLAAREDGLTLDLARAEYEPALRARLEFRITDEKGDPIREYQVEHARRMHVIVVRDDMTRFQHLHPQMAADGTWSTTADLAEPGRYRVFADFNHEGADVTLGDDVTVAGPAERVPLPEPATTADPGGGYEVELIGGGSSAGAESELAFEVTRNGEPVHVEPYLGADGHLVALREGDLAYLHVHPAGHGDHGGEKTEEDDAIRFATRFPSAGSYRLFLQFKQGGEVRTAEFTREVTG